MRCVLLFTMQDVKIGREYQAEVSDIVSAIISGMRNIGKYWKVHCM